MRLQSLAFEDQQSEWKLTKMEFLSDLTLLVGISGVGKTRILRSLSTLKRLASGDDEIRMWGTSWVITFLSNDQTSYVWEGSFETRHEDDKGIIANVFEDYPFRFSDELLPQPEIVFERLTKNGQVLVDRDDKQIRFNGTPTVKLSPHESVLHLLRAEEEIEVVADCLKQLLSVDHGEERFPIRWLPVRHLEKYKNEIKTLADLRNSQLQTDIKIVIAHDLFREVFDEITSAFIDVFPQVAEVSVRNVKTPSQEEVSQLQIREYGVDKWIPEHQFSSGMKRSLFHFARMALWPDGTVILIDEFENSLGVNCIDHVTRSLVEQSRRLQFVITSHHPYIINHIGVENWKIVTRHGSTVSVIDAVDLGFVSSSHESFIQLLNLPEYEDGIALA